MTLFTVTWRIKRFYHLVKWLITGKTKYKTFIRIHPEDIHSIEVGQTIKWVNRAECTFGFDEIEVKND